MTVTDAPKEEISLGLDTSEVTDFQSANTLYNIMSSKKVILEAKPQPGQDHNNLVYVRLGVHTVYLRGEEECTS